MAHAARGGADAAGRRRAGLRRARPARLRLRRAGCCCWSGRATTAATRCTPARCWPGAAVRSRRGCCSEQVHEGGLAALRAPAAGSGPTSPGSRPRHTTRGGRRRDRRHRRPPRACARRGRGAGGGRGRPVVAVDVPSGVDVDTGELDGPHVTRPRDRHLRHPQDRATSSTRRQPRRRRTPRRHRPRPADAAGRGAAGRRRGALCPGPIRRRTSTPAAWWRPGRLGAVPRRRPALRGRRRHRVVRHGPLRRRRPVADRGPGRAPRGRRRRAASRPGRWAPAAGMAPATRS